MSIVIWTEQKHQQMINDGWKIDFSCFYPSGPRVVERRDYSRPVSCCEAAARVSFCVIAGIMPCRTCCCVNDFTEKFYSGPCRGKIVLLRYLYNEEKTRETYVQDYQKLGFDPTNSASMRAYMERHPQEIRRCPSNERGREHEFLIFRTPVSKLPYILLAPYGNRDNIRQLSIGKDQRRGSTTLSTEQEDLFTQPDTTLLPMVQKICKAFREVKMAAGSCGVDERAPLLPGVVIKQPRSINTTF